jgi:hypothetical protein
VGSLWVLLGVLLIVGGSALADFIGGFAGIAITLGLVLIGFGVVQTVSGVRVLGLSARWRIGGIVLTAIGSLISLFFVIVSFSAGQDIQGFDPETFPPTAESAPHIGLIVFWLVLYLVPSVVALVLLARNGRPFVR